MLVSRLIPTELSDYQEVWSLIIDSSEFYRQRRKELLKKRYNLKVEKLFDSTVSSPTVNKNFSGNELLNNCSTLLSKIHSQIYSIVQIVFQCTKTSDPPSLTG